MVDRGPLLRRPLTFKPFLGAQLLLGPTGAYWGLGLLRRRLYQPYDKRDNLDIRILTWYIVDDTVSSKKYLV